MSIDNVDARFDEGHIEIGLFDGEDCRQVIPLTRENASELRQALDAAIEEEKAWREGNRRRPPSVELAHPDFPDDIFSTADQEAACAEGWALFEAHGYLEIEKDDSPDGEDVPEFESDDAAIAHVEAHAAAGSEMHQRALAIHRKYEESIRAAAHGEDAEEDAA